LGLGSCALASIHVDLVDADIGDDVVPMWLRLLQLAETESGLTGDTDVGVAAIGGVHARLTVFGAALRRTA
jgi:hypothetical protein